MARLTDSGDFEFFLDSASLLFPFSVDFSTVFVGSVVFVERFHFETTLLNLIAFRTLSNGLAANSATESGLDLSTVLSENEEKNGLKTVKMVVFTFEFEANTSDNVIIYDFQDFS